MSDATTEEKTKPDEVVLEVYPALSDLMLKADIIAHLRDVHGILYVRGNSLRGSNPKVSKETLLTAHDDVHRGLDKAVWKWVERAHYDGSTGTYVGAWRPFNERGQQLSNAMVLPHRHEGIEETSDLRAAAIAARTGGKITDKPMPAAQLRLLTEIVRQDFRIIEQEMREFAGEALDGRVKEIREEFKSKEGSAPRLKKKAETKLAKLQEELRQLREEASTEGISLTTPHVTVTCTFEIKGLTEALRAAQEENKNALARGLARLEREKAVALRRVQLAGISPEAVKLLDELPDARAMMVEAAAARPKELG